MGEKVTKKKHESEHKSKCITNMHRKERRELRSVQAQTKYAKSSRKTKLEYLQYV